MASLSSCLSSAVLILLGLLSLSEASTSIGDLNPPYPKAISELREAIVKGLGFQAEDIKVLGLDVRNALVGHTVAYEFDVEIDNKIFPLKLLEDVNKWEYVDLPIFRFEDSFPSNGLIQKHLSHNELPTLAPFQLAGPMELWIQDAKDMRISLPHDVDAGILKKVVLAEGAVVTVKGARSVSLRQPLDLPLPFNQTGSHFASGLLSLAEHLHHAAHTQRSSPLSLRIVGPTSLTSPTSSSPYSVKRLKLKRLSPGLVELSSPLSKPSDHELFSLDRREVSGLLAPNGFSTLWPLVSINGSNPNLIGFETLLSSILGARAKEGGSFKLLKADVSAQTYVKIGFGVEKRLKVSDGVWENLPEWRTKPESVRLHFEVLAKIDREKIVPERIMQVNPVVVEDTVAASVLSGNTSMSSSPLYYPPSNPYTL